MTNHVLTYDNEIVTQKPITPMIHPILTYGNEMLTQKSGEIPMNFPQIHELINDMFETMLKADGIGLSAIQIGIPLRIFVIEVKKQRADDFGFRGVFINPYIRKEFGNKVKFTEGCLSVPMVTAIVERSSEIELEYYDEYWKKHVQKFDGMAARIIQHEYDHLEGIVYVERLNPLWREAIEVPLQLIKDKKIEVKYLIK